MFPLVLIAAAGFGLVTLITAPDPPDVIYRRAMASTSKKVMDAAVFKLSENNPFGDSVIQRFIDDIRNHHQDMN